MRAGTDATGQAAIRAATEFILTSLRAKNELVTDKTRRQVERDVAGTFAWLVTSYSSENQDVANLARALIAGALDTPAHVSRLVGKE